MLPYDTRPHRWTSNGECSRCAIRSHWAGAKQPCGGIAESKPAKGSYDAEANAARRSRRESAMGTSAIRAEWRKRDQRRRERRAGAELEARR